MTKFKQDWCATKLPFWSSCLYSCSSADLLLSLSSIHHFYRDKRESNKSQLDISCSLLTFLHCFLYLLLEFYQATETQFTLINLSTPAQNWFSPPCSRYWHFFLVTLSQIIITTLTFTEYLRCVTHYLTFLRFKMHI